MYQILCDGFVLSDPRDEALSVKDKKCKIGSNICGEASFSIYANHPHYGKLKKLRSVFEIKQDNDTIFRGRMTDDTRDFDNMKAVDLEGAMAYLNDSVIRPFAFPDDFADATSADNIVEYFFRWLIEQHNSQVQPFQQFKIGKVTVKDKNNYISRSNTDYSKTWATIKEQLFESSLGGYLCIRYEADGNYLDYLADYVDDDGNKIVNSQVVGFGENLLDFKCESDGKETYSAVIPLGKKSDDSSPLTIEALSDGSVTDDIVKAGDAIYSKRAVAEYGWICAPTDETTFEDVTTAANLLDRGVSYLESKSAGFSETTTLTAMDLHLTDDEIEAFRVYRYVAASSSPHDTSGVYPLSVLDIDMENLQNTKITVGETKRTLTDKTAETASKVTVMQKTYTTSEALNNEITKIQTTISQTEEDIRLDVTAQYNELKETTSEIAADVSGIGLRVTATEEGLENVAAKLELGIFVDENGVVQSVIGASADTIEFNSNTLIINSDHFTLSAEGSVEATDIKLKNESGHYFVDISDGIVTVAGSGIVVQETVHDFPLLKFRGGDHYYALCVRCTFDEHPDGTYDWIPAQIIFRQSNYEAI